jgi:hypothetical protein
MTELERELRGLAPFVELPAERDLAPSIRARIAARRPYARRLALAFAFVALAIGVAFAVPPARSAILRWLGFHNVRIEFVSKLPNARVQGTLALGPQTSLAHARAVVPYHVLTSPLLGPPDEVHVLGDQVALLYGHRLTVIEVRGRFIMKLVGPGTNVDPTPVHSGPGYWISGKPHIFTYMDADERFRKTGYHLAGNTLVWQNGALTLRLEGKLAREQALKIADSFR